MKAIDPNDVFIHPSNWKEVTLQKALIQCEFEPVVAVSNDKGQRHATQMGLGWMLSDMGANLHAAGTRFFELLAASTPTVAQDLKDLIAAQNTARLNPAFQPSSGETHCNQATLAIAKAVGAPTGGLDGLLANAFAAALVSSKSYKSVTKADAQSLANQGILVIGAWQNPSGPGHVATVRPLGVKGDQPAAGSGPLMNNIGASVGVQYENWVFPLKSGAVVKYYTPG